MAIIINEDVKEVYDKLMKKYKEVLNYINANENEKVNKVNLFR